MYCMNSNQSSYILVLIYAYIIWFMLYISMVLTFMIYIWISRISATNVIFALTERVAILHETVNKLKDVFLDLRVSYSPNPQICKQIHKNKKLRKTLKKTLKKTKIKKKLKKK